MFFRAGVLGQMEEFRDERLGKIMTWMQSWIRGYLARKEYKKLQEQRIGLQVVQRNLRKYMQLRTWPWWKLWQKVKPLLNVTRVEDEIAVSIHYSILSNSSATCTISPKLLFDRINKIHVCRGHQAIAKYYSMNVYKMKTYAP